VPDIEVNTHVDAPPSRVWELIGDPTRMGEWSPECKRVDWAGRSTRPEVGARFRGHNRNGWRRWSTTGTLVAYEPEREVAWDVSFGPLAVARWGYRVEPDGSGCTVVESFEDKRGRIIKSAGSVARGVKTADTETHNRRGMEETLAHIKAEAETAS